MCTTTLHDILEPNAFVYAYTHLPSANDKEDDRMAYDSIISPRALREIYLMPFMLAEKYAKPWSYMTAYVFHSHSQLIRRRSLLS